MRDFLDAQKFIDEVTGISAESRHEHQTKILRQEIIAAERRRSQESEPPVDTGVGNRKQRREAARQGKRSAKRALKVTAK